MKNLAVLLSISNLLFFGCGQSSKEENPVIKKQTYQIDHQHTNENTTIKLDNGKKWKVDENMLIHIRNMETDINSFIAMKQEDYKSLAKKLETNIDLLISNCSMKGNAHDELHKWLLPYIDMAAALSNATNEEEASKQFENIQSSLKKFNLFFE